MIKYNPNIKTRNAILSLTAGALLISFSGVFVKLANMGPIVIGFYRMLFGSISLMIFILIKEKRIYLKRFKKKYLYAAFLCGLFFALDLTCWHKSVYGVGPGLATMLGNFQVFFLTAFGIIVFKEKIGFKKIIAILLAFLGISLLIGPGWSLYSASWKWGVFYGFLTAVAYAGYIITLRKLQTDADFSILLSNMVMVSLFTGFIMGCEAFVFKESFIIENTRTLSFLLIYGVLQQALGWVLIAGSLPHLKISTAGLILLLQPTLSFIWDIIFFGRAMTTADIVGVIITLSAIYLGSISKSV